METSKFLPNISVERNTLHNNLKGSIYFKNKLSNYPLNTLITYPKYCNTYSSVCF